MKKQIKIVIIIALYIGLIFVSSQVYATTGTTIKDTVRIREKASTTSKTVQLVSIDKEVEIVSKDGEWYKVKYNDGNKTYTGYIRNDMLKVEGEDVSESNTNKVEEKNETDEKEIVEKTSNEKSSTNSTNLDIRILPLINSSIIGNVKLSEKYSIDEVIGKWSYIETQDLSGWVLTSKLVDKSQNSETEEVASEDKSIEDKNEETKNETVNPTTKKMYVSTTTVNLREKANSSSKIIQQLSINTEVTVIETVDSKWSKVKVSGKTGYVASAYLSEKKTTTSRGNEQTRTNNVQTTSSADDTNTKKDNKTETSTSTETKNEVKTETSTSTETKNEVKAETSTNTETKNEVKTQTSTDSNKEQKSNSEEQGVTGADIVAYAKTFLGCRYVYGGTSPSGFDCSGFTQYVYKHFGYKINRTSSSQRSNGVGVSKSNLKAGDIVCFSGHVGIYIGGDKFIHAENQSKGVTISKLSTYSLKYITARRIL